MTLETWINWCKEATRQQKELKVGYIPMYRLKINLSVAAARFAVALENHWCWYRETEVERADIIREAAGLAEAIANIHNQSRVPKQDGYLVVRYEYDREIRKLRNNTKNVDRVIYDLQSLESTLQRLGKLLALLEHIGISFEEIDAAISSKEKAGHVYQITAE